jgi:hypothetical protein
MAAAQVAELALLKTITEIERIRSLRMLSHKDNNRLKHQPKLLLQQVLRIRMQHVRLQCRRTK